MQPVQTQHFKAAILPTFLYARRMCPQTHERHSLAELAGHVNKRIPEFTFASHGHVHVLLVGIK